MWVTSLPRRTDSVKAPGLDEDNRARKEPSKPRSSSIFSASTPDTDGWNHLREVISFVQKKSGVHKSAVGFQPWLFSPAMSSLLLQTSTSLLTLLPPHGSLRTHQFTARNFHTPSLVPTSSSLRLSLVVRRSILTQCQSTYTPRTRWSVIDDDGSQLAP